MESTDQAPARLEARALSASLTVNDLAASLAFYRDVVGFEVEREYGPAGAVRAIALQAGEVRILIAQDDGARGSDRIKGEGISLMISTPQDIDALADAMKARGAVLASEPFTNPAGMRGFRLRDPDGFLLVLSSGR